MPPLPLSPLVGPSPSYRSAAPSPHLLLLLLRRVVVVVPRSSPLVPPHTTTTQQLRLNSSSSSLLSSQNHYQRLNIPGDASPSTIKKSFYALSKTHHPDVNRSDPSAAVTFSLLSESYTVLSDPARRAAYDKQLFPSSASSGAGAAAAAASSGPGWNPAGGRSPSGLSRRRGSFRGPPASFYRNGGYGAHAAQRSKQQQQQQQRQTDGEAAGAAAHRHASHTDPLHHHHHHHHQQGFYNNEDDVPPHFDKAGHKRTHERQDERRRHHQGRARRALGDDDVEFEPQTSMAGHFFIVAGILGVTFAAPLVYLQCMRLGKKEKKGPRA